MAGSERIAGAAVAVQRALLLLSAVIEGLGGTSGLARQPTREGANDHRAIASLVREGCLRGLGMLAGATRICTLACLLLLAAVLWFAMLMSDSQVGWLVSRPEVSILLGAVAGAAIILRWGLVLGSRLLRRKKLT